MASVQLHSSTQILHVLLEKNKNKKVKAKKPNYVVHDGTATKVKVTG